MSDIKVTIKKGYKPIFDEKRDLLEIARDLDIKCQELIREKDKLLQIVRKANKIVEISSIIIKGSAKNLTSRLLLLEELVGGYRNGIKELSSEDSCNEVSKK